MRIIARRFAHIEAEYGIAACVHRVGRVLKQRIFCDVLCLKLVPLRFGYELEARRFHTRLYGDRKLRIGSGSERREREGNGSASDVGIDVEIQGGFHRDVVASLVVTDKPRRDRDYVGRALYYVVKSYAFAAAHLEIGVYFRGFYFRVLIRENIRDFELVTFRPRDDLYRVRFRHSVAVTETAYVIAHIHFKAHCSAYRVRAIVRNRDVCRTRRKRLEGYALPVGTHTHYGIADSLTFFVGYRNRDVLTRPALLKSPRRDRYVRLQIVGVAPRARGGKKFYFVYAVARRRILGVYVDGVFHELIARNDVESVYGIDDYLDRLCYLGAAVIPVARNFDHRRAYGIYAERKCVRRRGIGRYEIYSRLLAHRFGKYGVRGIAASAARKLVRQTYGYGHFPTRAVHFGDLFHIYVVARRRGAVYVRQAKHGVYSLLVARRERGGRSVRLRSDARKFELSRTDVAHLYFYSLGLERVLFLVFGIRAYRYGSLIARKRIRIYLEFAIVVNDLRILVGRKRRVAAGFLHIAFAYFVRVRSRELRRKHPFERGVERVVSAVADNGAKRIFLFGVALCRYESVSVFIEIARKLQPAYLTCGSRWFQDEQQEKQYGRRKQNAHYNIKNYVLLLVYR